MSLNDQDKKLLFKGLIVILVCLGLIFLYFKGMSLWNEREDNLRLEKERIIQSYQYKTDSILGQNTILYDSLEILSNEIDSLEKVKEIIQETNEEEINTIFDANATNHAEWLNTTISKLKDNTK